MYIKFKKQLLYMANIMQRKKMQKVANVSQLFKIIF